MPQKTGKANLEEKNVLETSSGMGIVEKKVFTIKPVGESEASVKLKNTEYIPTGTDTVVARRTFDTIGLEPRMSIRQPHLKLIDSTLAYEYSDRQTEVGHFISFITLFLGVCVSSITSLIIALQSTPVIEVMVAIHLSIISVSLLVVGIFVFLMLRASKKAQTAKKDMDSSGDLKEVHFKIVEHGLKG